MIACMHGSGVDVREMSGKALLVYVVFQLFQFSVRWRLRNPWQAPAVRGWTVCRFQGAHGRAPKERAMALTGTASIRGKQLKLASSEPICLPWCGVFPPTEVCNVLEFMLPAPLAPAANMLLDALNRHRGKRYTGPDHTSDLSRAPVTRMLPSCQMIASRWDQPQRETISSGALRPLSRTWKRAGASPPRGSASILCGR